MLARFLRTFLQSNFSRNPGSDSWFEMRAPALSRQVAALAARDRIRFAFLPSSETDSLRYFPQDLAREFDDLRHEGFDFFPRERKLADLDILVVTAHGSGISHWIVDLRKETGPDTIIAVWLFDNHIAQLGNIATALAADFVFPSHRYASAYLVNPVSTLGRHVPLCSCQWTREELAGLFEKKGRGIRSDKLLVNYVDYAFSWRSKLLGELKAGAPEADVLLMDPNDRSRYFDKSSADRFEEWLRYKATLILPVTNDLSTRVFDALAAGQVLLVPRNIADFDEVIPPEIQARLGIIRLPDLEVSTIRDAAARAVETYDTMGEEGARARNEYVLTHHMLLHRIGEMLGCIRDIAAGVESIVLDTSREHPIGLRLRP